VPSKYPVLTQNQMIRILKKNGFVAVSQTGSHRKFKKDGHVVVVPMHSEIAKGTLKSILAQAGLSLNDIQ
jgi:predicted RNA binding protein YcfA (HicA-like mRNA interferase family)